MYEKDTFYSVFVCFSLISVVCFKYLGRKWITESNLRPRMS